MRSRFRVLVVLLGISRFAAAQTSSVSGSLEGIVTDSSGGRIPQVQVTVREVATRLSRQVSTDSTGLFRISQLPPGLYEVLASQAGFSPYRHAGVALALGSTVHLDIVLPSEAVTTQVTVTAQPPAIDPAQTSVTSGVDRERIEELPVESRNYLNFVLLAPGVAASVQSPAGRAAAALPDSGFTFGGLRGRSNHIAIDGLDNNDEYEGSSRTELSLEIVQEFQVVNAGLSAETGGASGGSINVVTRTGANAHHGDAFGFIQDGALNARNPFEAEPAAPSLRKLRFGTSQGGPLIRNRTFYYAAFEQEHNRALEDAFLSPLAVTAINQVPGAPRVSDDRFPTARAETEASAKLNHQLTPSNSLMLRYAFTNNREAGDAFHNAGWDDPSARGSSFTQDHDGAASLTSLFTPQTVGDLRFQLAQRRAVVRTNDASGPGVTIAGLVNFGRPYDGNGRRTETHTQGTYTLTYSRGKHLWKAGATVNHVHLDSAMADGFGGTYIYASLADFIARRPDQFRQAFGSPATRYGVASYGAFLQDHWVIAPKLTLDVGLRYDFEHLPSLFAQDTNNVSPRAGLAYHIAPSWIVQAEYGVFFDRYVLANLNRAVQKDGIHASEQVFDGAPVAPFFAPSIYTPDPRMATSYSQQSSFAVEHLIARDLTASATYLYVRGVKLPRTRNLRPATYPGDIFQLEDSASSTYQGASLTLNRRMSNELAFSASYTLSKTYDNASDFDEQPQNPLDLASEWAVSLQHRQQRLVLNGLWELPIGEDEPGKPAKQDWVTRVFGHIEAAPIMTMQSGSPVNPLTGIDTYRTHAFPLSARPAGFGRNSLRTPGLVNLDFRLLKYFPFGPTARLDFVAEAFNLFNRANVAQINPVFGPNFLQPLTAAGARQIQFSLDFEF